ncbi:MAG: 3-isopropylmalate dehydrogenase, partial [Lachnospiraceae bacterium]|nr:3-isopropylmalate dehydrogenase [Lachnospiraceae bacterium]
MEFNIAVMSGDGIGPEIVEEAKKVLLTVGEKYGHTFHFKDVLIGGISIDTYGEPLTGETIEIAKESDAVLLGAVGGVVGKDQWYELPPNLRPEAGLLGIRKALTLYANLRPAYLYEELNAACPLKESIAKEGFDMVVVRELTGGLYFGARETKETDGVVTAIDSLTYTEDEIRRIAKTGFEIAMKRRKNVISVDKANVLESSRLWRETVHRLGASEFPDVELDDMYVDNAAMQIIRAPSFFDVIVTSNMFGDILSDEASQVTGSIGLLASASLGDSSRGMYEPIHGSAP